MQMLPRCPRKGAAMCAVSLLSSRTALWPGVRHGGPWTDAETDKEDGCTDS